jgi:hypothetical protein
VGRVIVWPHDVSVDAGIGVKNGTGWACWSLHKKLALAGLARPDPELSNLDQKARSVIAQLPRVVHGGVLHLEHMQVYGQARQKGDPNDLVSVAYLEGMISSLAASTTLYLPHEWKGNVPEVPLTKRIRKRLAEDDGVELAVLDAALKNIPKSLSHNVYDAVGIGLYAYGRLH